MHLAKTTKTIPDIIREIQYLESVDCKNLLFLENNCHYKKHTRKVLPNISTILKNAKTKEIEICSLQNQRAFELLNQSFQSACSEDTKPTPLPEDREGYYDDRHLEYWLSGFHDYIQVKKACQNSGIDLSKSSLLDIGCSSGRFLRHVYNQCPEASIYGCDINIRTIDWLDTYFGDRIFTFQNTCIASLPFRDGFFDVITAFSVFTHIWHSIDTWLLEIHRILKKNGLFYVTIQSEQTWANMKKNKYSIFDTLKKNYSDHFDEKDTFEERIKIFKPYNSINSYNAQVFISTSHIKKKWSKLFKITDLIATGHGYQDCVVMQKIS